MTTPPTRWPLHPPPGPLESLSSWLDRLAVLYGMTASDLIGVRNLELGGVTVPYNLDIDAPEQVLVALAERTGVDAAQLRGMTLTGWTMYLFDTPFPPRPGQQQLVFDTYVRANPVLLALGEAGQNNIAYPRSWAGPWRPIRRRQSRQCPTCSADPERGKALVWQLPLMLGCGEHACYLEDSQEITLHRLTHRQPMPPRPLPESLGTLEGYTRRSDHRQRRSSWPSCPRRDLVPAPALATRRGQSRADHPPHRGQKNTPTDLGCDRSPRAWRVERLASL